MSRGSQPSHLGSHLVAQEHDAGSRARSSAGSAARGGVDTTGQYRVAMLSWIRNKGTSSLEPLKLDAGAGARKIRTTRPPLRCLLSSGCTDSWYVQPISRFKVSGFGFEGFSRDRRVQHAGG